MIGQILANFDQSLFAYAIPGIMETFDVGLETIGSILSLSFIFAAIVTITIGVAADRFGRRKLFIFCLASSALLVSFHALAPTILSLTMFRACAFGLSAGILPLAQAYTAEAAPARIRGFMAGMLQCGYAIGWFLAALIGAPILEIYGWRYIFLPALLVIPLTFIIAKALPESERFEKHQSTEKTNVNSIFNLSEWFKKINILLEPQLRSRTLWSISLFFFQGGAYAGTAFYFPTFFSDVYGYSERDAASIVGLSYGIGVIGYISVALIGEFLLTRRNTILIFLTLGTFALSGLIWLPSTYMENVIWFGLMTMTFYAAAAAMWALAAELFPTRARATASAIMLASILISFATYPIAVAYMVKSLDWKIAFTIVAIPSAILATISAAMLPNIKSGLDIDDIAI
jgi:MFS family permease